VEHARGSGRAGRERRELILAEVRAGNGHVESLAERLDVSVATIRRDLRRLMEEGRITRTYGGAVASPRPLEFTLQEKELSYRRQKDAIARLAAGLVEDGEVIILDAGTTTGRLAWYLRERRNLTVVTNGLSVLLALRDADGVEVVVLGGQLRHLNQALIGGLAEANLRQVTADRVFLGADGLSPDRGLNCPTLAQATLKGLMLHRAREAFVVADHSKLASWRFPYVTPLDRPWTLITDDQVAEDLVQPYRRRGTEVMLAEVGDREGGR
jgi:DeoR family fructose operon transcriptional repressor